VSTTIVKPKADSAATLTPRQERQVYNRTKYRLNKRRNLWLNSIARTKNPKKVEVLQLKIEVIDFALQTLEQS
jgi:hypothetical protein